MRRVAALCCVAVALCLILAWELAVPDRTAVGLGVSIPPPPPGEVGSGKTPPAAPDAEALAQLATTITERPLFSATRRSGLPSAGAAGDASAAAKQGPPRLTGTLVGPSGARAIFAGTDGKSHATAEGDAVGAFKVRTIEPGIVTLSGSEGNVVLRPTFITSPGTNAAAPELDAAIANGTVPIAGSGRGGRNHEATR